jgi:hypothetical protein
VATRRHRDSAKLDLGSAVNAEALLADLAERIEEGGDPIATEDELRAWRAAHPRTDSSGDATPLSIRRASALEGIRVHRGEVGAYVAGLHAKGELDGSRREGAALEASLVREAEAWKQSDDAKLAKYKLHGPARGIGAWWDKVLARTIACPECDTAVVTPAALAAHWREAHEATEIAQEEPKPTT